MEKLGAEIQEKSNFINDDEKMRDLFELTRIEFLNSYSYITDEEYDNTLDIMWAKLSDIPVTDNGEYIEDKFYIFDKGIKKENIWHWFDTRLNEGIGKRYF